MRYLSLFFLSTVAFAQIPIGGGGAAGGGGSIGTPYSTTGTATSVSITAATHGKGTAPIWGPGSCFTTSTGTAIVTGLATTVAANGDVSASWTGSIAYTCRVFASGQQGAAGPAGATGSTGPQGDPGVGSSKTKAFTTSQHWLFPASEHGLTSCNYTARYEITSVGETPALVGHCAATAETFNGQAMAQYDYLLSWNSTQSGYAVLSTGAGGVASAIVASGTTLTVTHSANLTNPYGIILNCLDEDTGQLQLFSNLSTVTANALTVNFSGTVTNVRCSVKW